MEAAISFAEDITAWHEEAQHSERATFDYLPPKQTRPIKKVSSRDASMSAADVMTTELRSAWLSDELKRVTALRQTQVNWDSYNAEVPNATAAEEARNILSALALQDFRPARVTSSVEGGICITFRTEDRYADFECFNSGVVLAALSRNVSDPIVWEVRGENDIRKAINRIRAFVAG